MKTEREDLGSSCPSEHKLPQDCAEHMAILHQADILREEKKGQTPLARSISFYHQWLRMTAQL